MKYIVLFIVLLGVYYGQADEDAVETFLKKVFDYSKTCQDETGVDRESMLHLLKGNLPTTREGKCYVSCFMKKFEMQNADGTFNKEKTLHEFEKLKRFNEDIYHKAVTVVEICAKKVIAPGDACDDAALIAQCTFTTAKENGLDKDMIKVFAG